LPRAGRNLPRVRDLNGDGFKDLAVVNGSANTVTVVLGQGNGSFGPATSYTTQVGPGSVGLGDFNGDLKLDLAVPTFFGSGATSALTILQNTGAGAFAFKAAYETDSRPVGIAVTDFTGDHKLDLAIVNNFADNVFVFPGSGSGTFGAATAYVVGDRPTWATRPTSTATACPTWRWSTATPTPSRCSNQHSRSPRISASRSSRRPRRPAPRSRSSSRRSTRTIA